jgi:magnesium transporter
MKLVYTIGNLQWIDLIGPTDAEIRALFEEFHLDPIVAEELMLPVERPKVESYDDYLYLVLHFPELGDAIPGHVPRRYEVDFLIFKSTLITVHPSSVPLLYEYAKSTEIPGFAKSLPSNPHAGHLFLFMLRHFYTNIAIQLDDTSRNLHRIEDRIFANRENEMVHVLSGVNRKLLDLQRAIQFHGDTIKRFAGHARDMFGAEYLPAVKKVYFEYRELSRTMRSLKDATEDLWKTNDTLVNTKVNDTMRKLTALSFVTFPLSVIVGLFGMNMNLPLIGGYRDFLIVILAMIGIAAALTSYLQHRKWL